MYITLKSIKRNFGFKGIEIADLIIAFPIIVLFIILFCFTSLQIPSLIFLLVSIFCLLPVNVSKKNRMYKVLGLMFQFISRQKIFIYQNIAKESDFVEKETY